MAINIWGQVGNAAYALPLVQLTPDLPNLQSQVLAWNPAEGALGYAPLSVNATTGVVTFTGNLELTAGTGVLVNGLQVLGSRITGWGVPTGTATRSTFDTSSVTTAQLAERVKALIDDLTAHGLIGA